MRLLVLWSLAAVTLYGQGLHAGIVAGIPLTQYFETGNLTTGEYSAATRRYVVGASLEWDAARRFGLASGVLFHRMGYVAIVVRPGHRSAIDVKGDSWDFPLMAKYRWGRRRHPFVAAGGVLRYVGPVRGRGEETNGSLMTALDTESPSELRKRFYPGLTAGAGVEFRAGALRVSPELRFTRWMANIAAAGESVRFAPNQAELLVGFSF